MQVNFRRILHYLWPQIRKHYVSFVLVFFSYGVALALDSIIKPLILKQVIDLFSSGLTRDVILYQATYLVAITSITIILHNIGYRVGDYANFYFESNTMKNLYDFTFEKLIHHSYYFFSNNFSGSIIAKSKRFTKSFETLSDIVSYQVWFSLVVLTGILIILFIYVPVIATIFLVWSLFYVLITGLFIRKKMRYDSLEASADSLVTGRLSDVILNILNIKIFSSDKKEKYDFEAVTGDEEKKRRRAWHFGGFQNIIQGSMMAILQILILFISLRLWYNGQLTLGMFVLIQTYIINLLGILWNLGNSLTRAMKALTDMQEVVDIFDTPIDILDPVEPETLKIREGHINFIDISFAYKGGILVLDNFNLDIEPKERVGIVGHSGAGKSTLTKLLLRFADTTSGNIFIDGQNIKNITQNDLRSVISYVPQESILFHRTIRENIAYGRPDASQEEIEEVSKRAFAHDFIIKLPKSYDTLVGERGIKLSGGERQRIAIARAMLKNSPILVLDEATSSLDSISESYIQAGFNELMKNKTTIVIAHRLSTISKMDRIIVLENGNIVETGKHQDLVERHGVYADLWNHQSGGFLEE